MLLEQQLETAAPDAVQPECVACDVVQKSDIATAARIFVQSFPRRVNKWFRKEQHATQFYNDLLELMLRAHGRTFFVVRENNLVVGFLVLTLPNLSLGRALLRKGFVFYLVAHYVSGRYGFSLSMFRTALKSLVTAPFSKASGADPHVYVVAVDNNHTGKGIGSALIERAKAASRNQFNRLMLNVEVDNVRAIRLYERIGFRIVKSDSFQHEMVCDF